MKTELMMLVGTARRAVRNLALVAVVAMAFGAWAETETVGDYTWTYQINGGTAEISRVSPSTGAVTIPATLGGKPVTSIGTWAFNGCSGLTSVTIPDSVTSIGDYAFRGCSGLTNVVIGSGVTSIGWSAFSGCSGMISFAVAAGNANYKSVNRLLLSKDGKTLIAGVNGDVIIPDGVTDIGEYAFSGCSGLTSVHITDLVKWCGISFRYPGFNGVCSNPLGYAHNLYLNGEKVTDLVIPDSVTSIGARAFYGCSGLTSVTIPGSVTYIDVLTFSGCSGLTSVTIPNGVTSIGDGAFRYCSGLTSVTIPDSVTSIGGDAFSYCSGLMNISVGAGNANYKSVNGLLLSKDGKTLVHGVNGDVLIPDSVTSIGEGAFYGCSGLTSVTIPDGVTSIGAWAFYGCSGLTSVTIPDSVTSIGGCAFSYCSGLMNISVGAGNANYKSVNGLLLLKDGKTLVHGVNGDVLIPDSVTSIGNYAFYGCSGLTSVTIPDSVTSIGYGAFWYCDGLMSVTVDNGNANYSSMNGLLLSKDGKTLILGVNGAVTIPDGVTSIGDSAFVFCSGLTSVTIPDSVTNIGSCAFGDCSGLTSVTIPGSVTCKFMV